jgi:hypothetical protein
MQSQISTPPVLISTWISYSPPIYLKGTNILLLHCFPCSHRSSAYHFRPLPSGRGPWVRSVRAWEMEAAAWTWGSTAVHEAGEEGTTGDGGRRQPGKKELNGGVAGDGGLFPSTPTQGPPLLFPSMTTAAAGGCRRRGPSGAGGRRRRRLVVRP